jgi:hypothetical protein
LLVALSCSSCAGEELSKINAALAAVREWKKRLPRP